MADDEKLRRRIEALHNRYVHVIDQDRLEEWPDLFTEACLYKIVTRENFDQGLPLAVMECRSRGMLQDRVTGLRRINFFEPHRYLHQISALVIEPADESGGGSHKGDERRVICRSNYLVVRTTSDGTMTLFSAGIYMDRIVLDDRDARFEERIVIADSRRIETLLVIPL
jgi:anthranilate 1,2-dioxygenase small subunit